MNPNELAGRRAASRGEIRPLRLGEGWWPWARTLLPAPVLRPVIILEPECPRPEASVVG